MTMTAHEALTELDRRLSELANKYMSTVEAYHLHGLWRAHEELKALRDSLPQAAIKAFTEACQSPFPPLLQALQLLRDIKQDLDDRAEDGVVGISNGVWRRLCNVVAPDKRLAKMASTSTRCHTKER